MRNAAAVAWWTCWAALAGWGQAAPAVEPGALPRAWAVSGPDCKEGSAGEWQIHRYNADLYILRESGCSNYEKPFLFLIFGQDKVLLEDTGAGKTDVAKVVDGVIAAWMKEHQRSAAPALVVIHSHAHGDHCAGDGLFRGRAGVTFVEAKPDAIQAATQMAEWPAAAGFIELGNRRVDVLAVPGHDHAAVTLYDARTGLLLTGDTLYPGRLYVRDFPAFLASVDRMVAFTATRPVAHILGTHIEQSRTAFVDYPVGTVYQPDEMGLELSRGDLLELQAALREMGGQWRTRAMSRFTIVKR